MGKETDRKRLRKEGIVRAARRFLYDWQVKWRHKRPVRMKELEQGLRGYSPEELRQALARLCELGEAASVKFLDGERGYRITKRGTAIQEKETPRV